MKVAQYWDVKGFSEKDDPMTTTRIYWCVGFGNTAETLSQQIMVKNIFQAIFNIVKKPPPVEGSLANTDPSLKTSTTEHPNTESSENVPITPFIHELFELSKVSKPDHPSKKLPVMNVLYEDPPLEEENLV